MTHKVVIVTGSNAGIGRITALAIAKMGATVVMICRDAVRGEIARRDIVAKSGNTKVDLLIADLSSIKSINTVADEILAKYDRLNVLVNNAGTIIGTRQLSADGYEMTFALNHLGYFLLTSRLLPLLKQSAPSRIVNVASLAHYKGNINFDDLMCEAGYGEWKAYRQSKLANILFTAELARRLQGTGVSANCLHPGVIASNFGQRGSAFLRTAMSFLSPLVLTSPEKGAETSIYLATSPEVEGISGKYYSHKKITQPSAEALDMKVAARLWEVSERLIADKS